MRTHLPRSRRAGRPAASPAGLSGYPGASALSRARLCANSSWRGNTDDSDTQTRRTLTRTKAASFSSKARIVPNCACASSVPASPRCRSIRADTPDLSEAVRIEAAYFEGHADRMRYAEFRRQDLFVGSGVIEAGCRTVVGRLKRSGMFWTVDGANAIIALRCAQLSNRFDDYYWEDRAAA